MLSNLQIKNFRMLEDLEIPELGRVNLIVGKNNSGKSTVLEALRIYASKADTSLLREIILGHDESFSFEAELNSNGQQILTWGAIKHLFNNRQLPIKEDKSILIGDGDGKNIIIDYVYYYIEEEPVLDEDGDFIDIKRKRIIVPFANVNKISETKNPIPAIRIKNGSNTSFYDMTDELERSRPSVFQRRLSKIKTNCSYVPTDFIGSEALASLWDKIALSPKEDLVIEALRIIDSNLDRLTFVDDINSPSTKNKNRLAIVALKNSESRIPLNSMGDGMSRILQLILSVFPAEDGILLIDEFENGLHYAVQEEVWKIIFKLATELNIQVFATTHSWDCIESFSKVANENDEDGILIKLSRSKLSNDSGKVKATIYSENDLQNITASSLEVR